MLLNVLKYGFSAWVVVSLLRVYWAHPIASHWVAAKKFAFIWIVSTSPVICAALLAQPATDKVGADRIGAEFEAKVYSAFSLGEQFVYAATFIAPVLYIFIEAILIATSSDTSDKFTSIRQRVRGFGSLLLPAIILIVITVLSFAAARNPETFKSTFLFIFLGTQSLILYALSLGLWYAAILLDTLPNMDFAEETRAEARQFAKALKRRLGGGESDD